MVIGDAGVGFTATLTVCGESPGSVTVMVEIPAARPVTVAVYGALVVGRTLTFALFTVHTVLRLLVTGSPDTRA